MKKISLLGSFCFILLSANSQQTYYHNNPQEKFSQAKEFFQKGQYNLAYPLFQELNTSVKETDMVNNTIVSQEINFYTIVCQLKQDEGRAEQNALDYVHLTKNNARVQMMNFHLAEFYFRRQEFADAVALYEGANIANLSNEEIADMKFHQGYSYFTLQQFAKAKPLLNSIRQMKSDANYIDANYYYGFIAFRDKNYNDALQSFLVVENEPDYKSIVPYYIAQIYYVQGKKDEAIKYAENKLSGGNAQYYDLELKQMLGHAYFEKKQYDKAGLYLKDYVARSKKVSREDLYELSYSYYQAANFDEAIQGFKQLSGNEDSLSQHAMYLLGDSYLKTGQRTNARNAFLFSSVNNSNMSQREISRFNYAKLSYELGYQDEALKSLRSFLTDYPQSVYFEEATDLLVGALANTNNYKDALTLLNGLKNPSQNTKRLFPRILYGRATELINDGNIAEAEVLLNRALQDPNNSSVLPLINFWKGELAFRKNNIDDATKYYYAYLNAGAPTSGEANAENARYNLGYAYYKKENYPVALTYFEPLAKNAANSSDGVLQDAYVRAADAHYMNRNYAQAKAMYDNVIKMSWKAEDYATFQKAMISGINSPTEKIALMNNMVRKFPQSFLVTDANMEIANTYLADERYKEAIPYLNIIANQTANSSLQPQAYLKLGIAYYNLNQKEEAISQYKNVINKYTNSPEAEIALINLKAVYVEAGRPGEYAEVARQAGRPLTVSAEDSLTFAAAELQYESGNGAAALESLNKYVQRFENGTYATNAHYYLGEIYGTKKDWNNALTNYRFVAERAPNTFAEKAVLQAARINFFELKNYAQAEKYYAQLNLISSTQESKLEAMRGLLRSQYQQQKWNDAVNNAKELLAQKGSSTDDKTLANMAIGKSAQINGQYDVAITNYKAVIGLNKAALAAEARYEIASTYLQLNRLNDAEKAAFEVINKSGSYDWWVTKAYILLGDVYLAQKDYFNAKATYQSVVENSLNAELKAEAESKLNKVTTEESKNSKVAKP